jgi:hypothetical protein
LSICAKESRRGDDGVHLACFIVARSAIISGIGRITVCCDHGLAAAFDLPVVLLAAANTREIHADRQDEAKFPWTCR